MLSRGSKPDRMSRVNRLLQTTLAEMVPSQVKDPRVRDLPVVAITAVRTTPDLRHARVYVMVNGPKDAAERALDGLKAAGGYLRSQLGRRVTLRYTPELHFELDETEDNAARIERILAEISLEQGPDGETSEERGPDNE